MNVCIILFIIKNLTVKVGKNI